MGYVVTFLVIESNTRVSKGFDSAYKCKNFVNKVRHSKKLRLLSYPYFDD